MSNLLHLKEAIPELENFLQDVRKVMAKNCMILICVHAGESEGNEYFRYFTLDKLKLLFPEKEFKYIYWAHHQGEPHKYNIKFGNRYMGLALDKRKITDPVIRTLNIRNYNAKNRISDINLLIKRKS